MSLNRLKKVVETIQTTALNTAPIRQKEESISLSSDVPLIERQAEEYESLLASSQSNRSSHLTTFFKATGFQENILKVASGTPLSAEELDVAAGQLVVLDVASLRAIQKELVGAVPPEYSRAVNAHFASRSPPTIPKIVALLSGAAQGMEKVKIASKLDPELLASLKKASSLVDPEVLEEAIGGFKTGRDWVLQKFGSDHSPQVSVGHHTGSLRDGRQGLTETQDGDWVIGLQLAVLENAPRSQDHPLLLTESDLVHRTLTLRQHYEGIGVEETLHWLQLNGVPGTVSVLPEELIESQSGSSMDYLLQEHEYQGLVERGVFFQEKYGVNPLEQLERIVGSTRSSQPAGATA